MMLILLTNVIDTYICIMYLIYHIFYLSICIMAKSRNCLSDVVLTLGFMFSII